MPGAVLRLPQLLTWAFPYNALACHTAFRGGTRPGEGSATANAGGSGLGPASGQGRRRCSFAGPRRAEKAEDAGTRPEAFGRVHAAFTRAGVSPTPAGDRARATRAGSSWRTGGNWQPWRYPVRGSWRVSAMVSAPAPPGPPSAFGCRNGVTRAPARAKPQLPALSPDVRPYRRRCARLAIRRRLGGGGAMLCLRFLDLLEQEVRPVGFAQELRLRMG